MKLVTSAALAFLTLGISLISGQVVVSSGDISSNSYTFTIGYADNHSSSGPVTAGTYTNAAAVSDTSRFVASLAATGSIVYNFDFSGSGYTPTSFSFRDRVTIFSRATTTVTTEWSTDNANWTTLRTVAGTANLVDSIDTVTGSSITGSPTNFYYRVTFENDPGFSSSGYPVQWNRLDSSGEDLTAAFTASFTVAAAAIPEPSTYAAILGTAALGLTILRRRRQVELSGLA